MKTIIGGCLIILLAAITTVTVISIFDGMITSACEHQKLNDMSQYCYERLIKTN
jgi:hypothetical protein